MQLFGTMQPGGPTTTSMTTNFSPQQLEKFCVKISKAFFGFHCKARSLISALSTKNTYASVFVLEKRPLKDSKRLKIFPLGQNFNFLLPFQSQASDQS